MKPFFKRLLDWQHWPFYVFHAPISYAWVVYFIKSRSIWYYTASNPTLAFGGFEGEGKREMYRQLPEQFCPKSTYIQPGLPFAEVLRRVQESGLTYPFIVKPNVGMKGILFRKIGQEEQLRRYHEHMPAEYIVQEFLNLPYEVSVFYVRMPGAEKGRITALIQKNLPEVVGDGQNTLGELVARHPLAGKWLTRLRQEQGPGMNRVLPSGEIFCLSHIGNLVNGAQFDNLKHLIDDQLQALFDAISHKNQFYYGRYDIKCASVEDLKKGKNFAILEFNGAGSVPNHIYTGTYTLMGAYREILLHWKYLYQISAANNRLGVPYYSLLRGHRFLKASKKHFDLLKKIGRELVLNPGHNRPEVNKSTEAVQAELV